MMRVLLVEDDESAIEAVGEILLELPGRPLSTIARNRDAAFNALEREFFDLMILDLTIPADDSGGSPQPEFGLAVFGRAKDIAPGMPIFLLTGSFVENFVQSLLANTQQVNIWASGNVATVVLLKKLELDQCAKMLLPFVSGVHALADVELERHDVDLTIEDERLLRIFAKRNGGTQCVVWPINRGLSESRILKLKVLNAQGGVLHHAVAKLGRLADIQDESSRYQRFVIQLVPGATPRLLTLLDFGAKATAGVFYGLAEGHEVSFFEFANRAEPLIQGAMAQTSDGLGRWHASAARGQYQIRDVRRRLVSDEARQKILQDFPIDWSDEFEDRRLQVTWGCIHGDLHGANVLLSDDGRPAVIDYGDIGPGPSSLDPIVLELSLSFHPDGPLIDTDWPNAQEAANWGSVDQYAANCPLSTFVKACRQWATAVAAGNREIAACAYAYLLRQLKYPDTNKRRALELLDGAKRLFDST